MVSVKSVQFQETQKVKEVNDLRFNSVDVVSVSVNPTEYKYWESLWSCEGAVACVDLYTFVVS